jgi:hypothetical protein
VLVRHLVEAHDLDEDEVVGLVSDGVYDDGHDAGGKPIGSTVRLHPPEDYPGEDGYETR